MVTERRIFPLTPGVVLGIGLGGFVNGIMLHQVLQWHHMLTSAGCSADSVQNVPLNTLFDGLFHAATWAATTAGLYLLHRAVRRGDGWSGRRLKGGSLIRRLQFGGRRCGSPWSASTMFARVQQTSWRGT